MRQMTLLLMLASSLPFAGMAANKEHEAIQRDIAGITEQLRNIHASLNNELTALKTMAQQSINASDKAQSSVLVLETRITERMQTLEKTLAQTVANLNARVDTMATEFQGIKEESKETNARLLKMSTKIDELKTLLQIIAAKESAPPPVTPGPGPGGSASGEQPKDPQPTPPAINGAKLFEDADRDRMAGKTELAIKGYGDFLRGFPKSDRACEAQYRIGELLLRKEEVFKAAAEFDMVIERYDSSCTFQPAARYMKGRAFVKADQPSAAAAEFRRLAEEFKGTEWERKAKDALKEIGFSASPPKPSARAAKKRPSR